MQQDIVIIGGGLVGLCAALALQQPHRQISVIESSDLSSENSQGLNARSIALSYSSVQIFRALGLWQVLKPLATAISSIHVSARGNWGVARLDAHEYDLEALGYVIESRDLAATLKQAVAESRQVRLHTGAAVESIDNAEQLSISYRDETGPRQTQTAIALIADGALSRSRGQLGIEHAITQFGQSALITNVLVSRPLPNRAYERFTDNGPLAMLPLGLNRYSCIWTNDTESAERIARLDDAEFIASLQQCFGFRLGYIKQVGARFNFPIQRIRASSLTKGRCFLIGNAANALHPVAGQGFNLALRDIAALHELLIDQALAQLDQAGLSTLTNSYESGRQPEQQRVIQFGDGLVNLFSNELPLLGQARALSLALLDIIPALKSQLAFAGMGLTFEGNTLLRGGQ